MTITVIVTNEKGEEVCRHTSSALHPSDYKTHPERPVVEGDYQWFGFTIQPHVRLTGKIGGF